MTADKKERNHFLRLRTLTVAVAFSAILKAASAMALTEKEAATVVHLLESLQEEFGDFAYDAQIADEWFEQDADNLRMIEAAGFTAETWRRALDETYRGFLANIPEAEIRKSFVDARRRAEQSRLTQEQKQAALRMADEQEREVLKLRAEGKQHAHAVRFVTERLRALNEQLRALD
jgi:hypothetical protein